MKQAAAPERANRVNSHADTDPDREEEMLFGRQRELTRLWSLLGSRERRPIYVRGPQGIGKTAFLRWASRKEPMAMGRTAYIDCRWIASRLTPRTDVSSLVARRLLRGPDTGEDGNPVHRRDAAGETDLAAVLRCLAAESAPEPVHIWMDNVQELRAPIAFGHLDASAFSALAGPGRPPVCLILSGRGSLPEPMEAAFSPIHLRLPPLSEKSTYDMVVKPLKGRLRFENARMILRIHRLTGGHPHLIRGIREGVAGHARDRGTGVVAPGDLEAVVSGMARGDQGIVPDLWEDLPDGARRAAAALSELLSGESDYAPERKLFDAVNRVCPGMTEAEIRHALEFLGRDVYLVESVRQGDGIRFRTDVFRHWLSVRGADLAGESAADAEASNTVAVPARRRFSNRLSWSFAVLAAVSAAVLAGAMAVNRSPDRVEPASSSSPAAPPSVSAPIEADPPAVSAPAGTAPTVVPAQPAAPGPVDAAPPVVNDPETKTLAAARGPEPTVPVPRPRDMVRIGRFFIDRTEVSIRDYVRVFPDYTPPKAAFTEDMPAVNISHADARAYAAKTGKRLCTPSEWRTAIGASPGVDAGALHLGATDIPYGVDEESEENPHGLRHMTGNVSEWVDLEASADPAYIGGNWCLNIFEDVSPEAVLKVRRPENGGAGAVTIGFRCCMDAEQ